jgi:GTP-binding protein
MAFVDEVTIHAQAGRGGNGVIRWLRVKETAKGGPSGGDGGRGADIILEGVHDLAALATYRYTKKFRGTDGEAGGGENLHGKSGEPTILRVPVGTVATNLVNGETFDVTEEGQRVVIYKGGNGGRGNARFKSSTNQNPFNATPGKSGEGGDIFFSLKLIAEAGLIGFPNAGKSSLLNALTRAKSKVGNYAFTTLDPHLGDFYGHILADIPGLIEGASSGRGLGSKFLKHIERTKFLIHLVSADQDDHVLAYKAVRKELESFGTELLAKKELIVLSKVDILPEGESIASLVKKLEEASGQEVIPVSIIDEDLLKTFGDRLSVLLDA